MTELYMSLPKAVALQKLALLLVCCLKESVGTYKTMRMKMIPSNPPVRLPAAPMMERTKMTSQTAVKMELNATATFGDSFLRAIKMISIRSQMIVKPVMPTYTAATILLGVPC